MEKWDLLDEKGHPLGKTLIRGENLQAGQYHRVVHIWIVDHQRRMLIQKRAENVQWMPGVWAVTGGSAIAGEDSLTAARRELREEMGIPSSPEDMKKAATIRRRNSFCDIWFIRCDVSLSDLNLQKEEVTDARWVSWDQLMKMVETRQFHNYGKEYFQSVHTAVFGFGAME